MRAEGRPVRALVVDDSAAMRMLLRRVLAEDPGIEVVGAVGDSEAADRAIDTLDPDVLTLDIEMPGTDGLTFLKRLMQRRPMPVVMCSSLTAAGAAASIEALRLGAVDCIGKPMAGPEGLAETARSLQRLVRSAAGARVRPASPSAAAPAPAPAPAVRRGLGVQGPRLVAIGASTGGVEALFELLSAFPLDCPPTVIVQHMPAAFTGGFAARLNRELAVNVVEARDGAQLLPGTVHIAPGGERHMLVMPGTPARVKLVEGPLESGHRPSVDLLFRSVAAFGPQAAGVILTGMGQDGARGLLAMRQAGARTYGQSRESCVVYGMPRAAAEAGAIMQELDLSRIPQALLGAGGRTAARSH